MSARRVRIGIDTGGTFTDVVAVDEETGQVATTKTPSTPADPADGFLTGVQKVLGPAGPGRRRRHRGQPRHDGRHQPAARGQARPDRLHHHRGLRVGARDRPPVGARRLRQQLLLGQAAADRARPTWCAPCAAGSTSPARRSARSTRTARRRRPLLPRRRHHHRGRLLPARLRRRRPRAGMLEVLRAEHPGAVVSISSQVLREYREYERSVTTLVDAAVKPKVGAYVPQHPPPARRDRARRPLLRDEEQRRRPSARRGGQPADHHDALRPGRGRPGRCPDRRHRPASTGCSPATAAGHRPTSPSSSTGSRR